MQRSRVWEVLVVVLLVVIAGLLGFQQAKAMGGPLLAQRWEYLTVSYTQDRNYDDDAEETYYIEDVISNDRAYDVELFGDLICRNRYSSEGACKELFRGQAYYLNLWGNDGWELIDLTDRSDQLNYSVEMIFKRPM